MLIDYQGGYNWTAVRAATERAVAQVGVRSLSVEFGISTQAIHNWLLRGWIPAERCLQVERLTGVSRYELRPDVYGERPRDDTTFCARQGEHQ